MSPLLPSWQQAQDDICGSSYNGDYDMIKDDGGNSVQDHYLQELKGDEMTLVDCRKKMNRATSRTSQITSVPLLTWQSKMPCQVWAMTQPYSSQQLQLKLTRQGSQKLRLPALQLSSYCMETLCKT